MNEENNNEQRIDTDEIAKETANTFNNVKDQVKETFKKDELKNNAKETKNFIVGMFKDPIGELKNIANDSTNSSFKYAVITVIIWMLAILIYQVWYYTKYHYKFFSDILDIIKVVASPVIVVFVLSLIIFIFNKNKDKSLTTIISVVVAAKLPLAISDVVDILRIIGSKVYIVLNPFSRLCTVISTILIFFGIKFIFNDEDEKELFKKVIIIEGIYYIASILIGLLDITI
jgi:hypothetical protein